MANQKLSQLTELAVEPDDVDEIYISDGGTSKRITYGTFKAALLDNATHTGDATGSSALTLQPAAITGKGAVTVAAGDLLLVADISASPQVLGQVTAQSIANLAPAVQGSAILSSDTSPLVTDGYVLTADGAGGAAWEAVAAGAGDLKADGTVPLTANWDVGSFDITAEQFHSDIVTGTAPFTVASTTVVANLNADLLDGNEATAFATSAQGALADSALQNVVEDTTPQLGGALDAQGNNITSLGDVTFQTGAAGGAMRTGTSAADKFVLQGYDNDDTTYRTVLEVDAGNAVQLQVIADYLYIEDGSDNSKKIQFNAAGITTATVRTITMPDADVNLGDIATNTAKVTNATHSGDAVGDGALTLQPAAITGKGAVTVAGGDLLLVADVSASPQVLGQVTAQSIADLAAPQGTAIRSDSTSPAATDGYVLTADGLGGAAWEAAAAGSGDFKADGTVDMTGEFRTDVGTFDSDVANGASAVAYSYDTAVAYSTAGAKLASWKNNATEKLYIDKDGTIVSSSGKFGPSADTDANISVQQNSFNYTNFQGNAVLSFLDSTDTLSLTSAGKYSWAADASSAGGTKDTALERSAAGVVKVTDASTGNGAITFSYGQAAQAYTVATLPGTPAVGMMARVTDANAPAVGSTVTGSGAAAALVWYNGSNWTVIGV